MRRASIVLAMGSVVVPFAWAYFATTALYQNAAANGVYICGLPALATFNLSSFACVITSASAALVGFVAYRRLPRPRPERRLAEVTALALPLVFVGGLMEEPLAADTRRLVIDTLKEGHRAKLENDWQLDFALHVGDLGRFRGFVEMRAMCQARLRPISAIFLQRSAI